MTSLSSRRSFLRDATLTSAGFMFLPQAIKAYSPVKKDKVRLGMIAVGVMWRSLPWQTLIKA
jgi:hypothetical protein